MSSLVGALLLFVLAAFVGGVVGSLLLVLSFLALAGSLLALFSPRTGQAPRAESRPAWSGPRSLDEMLIREEIRALGLDAASGDDLALAARRLARERGVDPLAATRAIVEAIAGDQRDLALLGWPLRDGLSRAERVLELRSRR